MDADPVPVLPRGVRLHHDRVRGVPVLLGPERALMLDPPAAAILGEVDGVRRLSEIARRLAAQFSAPEELILSDTRTFLDGLADRRLVDYAHA